MDESRQRKSGAILAYVIIILNMIISIIYTPLLTSKLGQSEYGLYQYVNSIINLLTLLDLGLGSAIIIYISRSIKNKDEEKINKLFSMFLTIFLIIGFIASLIGLCLYFNVNLLFDTNTLPEEITTAKTLLLILTINIAISFPGIVFSNVINAHEKFVFLKVLNIISIILKPIIMVPLLFIGYKSITLVIITTLINGIVVLINLLYCKNKLKIKFDFHKWDKKLLKEIFAFSIWISLTEFVDKINWSIDNFLIGKMIGTIGVSVYSIASQLNNIFISTSTAISGVMLAKIAKINEEKDNMDKMNEIWINTGHIQLYIVGLILSGYIIFGRNFIDLWVGKNYNDAYIIGTFLMVPMFVSLIQNVASNIVRVKNKHKFMTIIYFVIAILNVAISIFLIDIFGTIGAALGTGIALIVGNIIIKNIYYYKVIKLDVIGFIKKMIPLLIIQSLLTIVGTNIINLLFINSWLILIVGIILYTIVYIVSTLPMMTEYEKKLTSKMVKQVRKKIWKK